MATFKAVLQAHKNVQGKHNIMIRVTLNRVRRFPKTDLYVAKNHFDAKRGRVIRHIKAAVWNQVIDDLISLAQTRVMEEKARGRILSIDQIAGIISGKEHLQQAEFFSYAERYIAAKYNAVENYARKNVLNAALTKLREFHQAPTLLMYEITTIFLMNFRTFIRKEVAISTANVYLDVINTVLSAARHDDSISYQGNPFYNLDREKEQIAIKRKELTDEELLRIERCQDLSKNQAIARDFFMCLYYLGGIRPIDLVVMKVGDYMDAKRFKARKTRKANKFASIAVHTSLEGIISPYLAGKTPEDYIFPYMQDAAQENSLAYEQKIRATITAIYRLLHVVGEQAQIPIPLTAKMARSTFLNRVRDEFGKETAREAGLHTSDKTTERYLEHVDLMQKIVARIFH